MMAKTYLNPQSRLGSTRPLQTSYSFNDLEWRRLERDTYPSRGRDLAGEKVSFFLFVFFPYIFVFFFTLRYCR